MLLSLLSFNKIITISSTNVSSIKHLIKCLNFKHKDLFYRGSNDKTFHFKAVMCMIDTLYPYIFQADLENEEFLYRIHRKLFPEFQMLLLCIDCIMVFLCNTWLTNILYKVIILSHSYWFLLFWNLVLCEVNIPSCGKIVALNLIVNEWIICVPIWWQTSHKTPNTQYCTSKKKNKKARKNHITILRGILFTNSAKIQTPTWSESDVIRRPLVCPGHLELK